MRIDGAGCPASKMSSRREVQEAGRAATRDTNNVTERVIVRSKIRYKTMRGYKSVEGMMNGLWWRQRVWGERGMDMGERLAA